MWKWLLTGGLVPPVLLLCGMFFLLYLRGYPFRAPVRMLRGMCVAKGERSGVSSFRAMMLALAGTLGVGNIVGVANAIAVGGAGAVFWMWISALLAMILKYAEVLLAVEHRRSKRGGGFFGGAVYYILDCLEVRRGARFALAIAAVFALLTVVDSLFMGCMIQVNAIGDAMREVAHVSPWIVGFFLLLITIPLLSRGTTGVSAVTEYLVPIMTAGYVVLSVAVLILRRDMLGDAVREILQGAFSARSAAGGVLGFLTSRALRVGTMRGLLSNEAGCGTAPAAHACADAKSPADQGLWGIFEVFADTILLCTATALVILVSGVRDEAGGVMMTVLAYSAVLGGFSKWFFCGAVFCFGYATLLCWGGYGLESVRFLTPKPLWRVLYLLAFGVCMLCGVHQTPALVWDIADFAIAAMTLINLWVLFLMRRKIKSETLRWARDGC